MGRESFISSSVEKAPGDKRPESLLQKVAGFSKAELQLAVKVVENAKAVKATQYGIENTTEGKDILRGLPSYQLVVFLIKTTLLGMEVGRKLILERIRQREHVEPWMRVIQDEEERGPGGPRGVFREKGTISLNHPKVSWVSPEEGLTEEQKLVEPCLTEEGKPFYLVKRTLMAILDPDLAKLNADQWYPVIEAKKWQGGPARNPWVRLIVGKSPQVQFIDVSHQELVAELQKPTAPTLLKALCEDEVPVMFEHRVQPVEDWFSRSPYPKVDAPYLSIRVGEDVNIPDPRSKRFTVVVHQSSQDKSHPVLIRSLQVASGHSLYDGVTALKDITSAFQSVVRFDDIGVRFPHQGRIHSFDQLRNDTEQKVENVPSPFNEGSFQYCREMAEALGQDWISETLQLEKAELEAFLQAAKILGRNVSTLFNLGIAGVSGMPPIMSVAPLEELTRKDFKTPLKRLHMVVFANTFKQKAEGFGKVLEWVQNFGGKVPFWQFMKEKLSLKQQAQLFDQIMNQAKAFEDHVVKAQTEGSAILTYNAGVTGRLRPVMERTVNVLAPNLSSLFTSPVHASYLGSPAFGRGIIEWDFESAGSAKVVDTLASVADKLSLRRFLDNPAFLFSAWRKFYQNNSSTLAETLERMAKQHNEPRSTLIDWLKQLQKQPDLTKVPLTLRVGLVDKKFNSVDQAIDEATKDGNVRAALLDFFADLSKITAWTFKGYDMQYQKDQFRELLHQETRLYLQQVVAMSAALAHILVTEQYRRNLAQKDYSHSTDLQNTAAQLAKMAAHYHPITS